MRVFLSYKFTGEDAKELKEVIGNICLSLEKAGKGHFCSFWKGDFYIENKFTHKQILEYALKELDNSDCILAFVKSEGKSEGMLIEIGYALAKFRMQLVKIFFFHYAPPRLYLFVLIFAYHNILTNDYIESIDYVKFIF